MAVTMHPLLTQAVFYSFAGLVLFSALMVILQNNPVRCVLFLVLAFFGSAILWLLAEAEFLSLILVLVYVGAVMTLFLFVVMMLNIDFESKRPHFAKHLPFGLILVALLVSFLMIALPKQGFERAVEQRNPMIVDAVQQSHHTIIPQHPLTNTEKIGMVLYTDYVYAFELSAFLLLVAIIAAITLMHRKTTRSKQQNTVKQIQTRRQDRVQLLEHI